MDQLREFLTVVREHGAAQGNLLGLLHALIGRRITTADGTLVSAGMTWRDLANTLKRERWEPTTVRELGLEPSALPPRYRCSGGRSAGLGRASPGLHHWPGPKCRSLGVTASSAAATADTRQAETPQLITRILPSSEPFWRVRSLNLLSGRASRSRFADCENPGRTLGRACWLARQSGNRVNECLTPCSNCAMIKVGIVRASL